MMGENIYLLDFFLKKSSRTKKAYGYFLTSSVLLLFFSYYYYYYNYCFNNLLSFSTLSTLDEGFYYY